MTDTTGIGVHKALADATRLRLYRYLKLSGRPVSVRELAARLSLHPNTLRPHLRRLEEAGLVASDTRRGTGVGRPQALYTVLEREAAEGRDYRLLAEILCGAVTGKAARERAAALAREWGSYLVAQGGPKPGTRLPPGRSLAVLQEAMAEAGFEPRFRRSGERTVEVTLRDCPFRDLVDDHRELVCALHRGLLEGMLEGLRPSMRLAGFEPLAERGICRLVARGRNP